MGQVERMYDVSYELLDDSTVRLTQSANGEEYVIDLHPAQILHIANDFRGGHCPASDNGEVADLKRRLAVLAEKIEALVLDQYIRGEILERCGDGLEFMARLDAILDLAKEFDGGRLLTNTINANRPASAPPAGPIPKTQAPAKANPEETHEVSEDGQLGLQL